MVSLEERERVSSKNIDEVVNVVEGLRGQRDIANAELTDAKVGLASEEQLLASFKRQLEPLKLRLEELRQRVNQRRIDIDKATEKKTQTEGEISNSIQRIDSVRIERAQSAKAVAEMLDQ